MIFLRIYAVIYSFLLEKSSVFQEKGEEVKQETCFILKFPKYGYLYVTFILTWRQFQSPEAGIVESQYQLKEY